MRGQIIGSIAIAASLLGACGKTRLMEAMVGTNETNKKILGQMFAVGGGGKAAIGSDGIARIAVEHHAEEPLPEGTDQAGSLGRQGGLPARSLQPKDRLSLRSGH